MLDNLSITARYSKKLSKDKTLFVSIGLGMDGKTTLNVSTAIPSGGTSTLIDVDEVDTVANFQKEVITHFNQLVSVSKTFISPTKEER